MGDVTHLYTLDGAFAANYQYDAWGNATRFTCGDHRVGDLNPILYRGYFYDKETSLYYLKTRYYDPETCRFLNADDENILLLTADHANGIMSYTYCANNPVMMVDDTGCFPLLISLLVGLAVGLASEFLGDLADDGKINRNWTSYLGAAVSGLFGGLGTGLVTTMLFSGVGDILGGLINGSITSFEQVIGVFALSAVMAGVGYGIAKGIQSRVTKFKYHKIIGNSTSNIKINGKLAKAGIEGVKIGKNGLNAVLDAIKSKFYRYLDDGINAIYDLFYGFLNSAFG